MAVATAELVTVFYPSEEALKELDRAANGYWQVYDGANWKFYIDTKEEARKLAKRLGGTHIAKCLWLEDEERSVYMNLEKVE